MSRDICSSLTAELLLLFCFPSLLVFVLSPYCSAHIANAQADSAWQGHLPAYMPASLYTSMPKQNICLAYSAPERTAPIHI